MRLSSCAGWWPALITVALRLSPAPLVSIVAAPVELSTDCRIGRGLSDEPTIGHQRQGCNQPMEHIGMRARSYTIHIHARLTRGIEETPCGARDLSVFHS